MNCTRISVCGISGVFSVIASSYAAGDVERGAKAARACMACHAFAPGRHMTGPSLAGVWDRKAGTAPGFGRYSDALKRSGTVWNEKSLDAWLKHPASLIPGNTMAFDVQGDRAAVVFARPDEISAFIRKECP